MKPFLLAAVVVLHGCALTRSSGLADVTQLVQKLDAAGLAPIERHDAEAMLARMHGTVSVRAGLFVAQTESLLWNSTDGQCYVSFDVKHVGDPRFGHILMYCVRPRRRDAETTLLQWIGEFDPADAQRLRAKIPNVVGDLEDEFEVTRGDDSVRVESDVRHFEEGWAARLFFVD